MQVHIDNYTRFILTVIAVCLLALCLKPVQWLPPAVAAEDAVTPVRLVAVGESAGPLTVEISNENLPVTVENTPLDVIINDPVLFGKRKDS